MHCPLGGHASQAVGVALVCAVPQDTELSTQLQLCSLADGCVTLVDTPNAAQVGGGGLCCAVLSCAVVRATVVSGGVV